MHLNKVFFADDSFNHESKIFGDGIAKGFTHDLARILDGELDFQVLVPIRIDIELALTNPARVIFIDIFNFEFVLDVEFFQSFQD